LHDLCNLQLFTQACSRSIDRFAPRSAYGSSTVLNPVRDIQSQGRWFDSNPLPCVLHVRDIHAVIVAYSGSEKVVAWSSHAAE